MQSECVQPPGCIIQSKSSFTLLLPLAHCYSWQILLCHWYCLCQVSACQTNRIVGCLSTAVSSSETKEVPDEILFDSSRTVQLTVQLALQKKLHRLTLTACNLQVLANQNLQCPSQNSPQSNSPTPLLSCYIMVGTFTQCSHGTAVAYISHGPADGEILSWFMGQPMSADAGILSCFMDQPTSAGVGGPNKPKNVRNGPELKEI